MYNMTGDPVMSRNTAGNPTGIVVTANHVLIALQGGDKVLVRPNHPPTTCSVKVSLHRFVNPFAYPHGYRNHHLFCCLV